MHSTENSNETKPVNELKGYFSANLANGQTLDQFCQQHFPEYNTGRFEAFLLRVLVGDETVITIYAFDKLSDEKAAFSEDGKFPVKKFKIARADLSMILNYFDSFNLTLSTGTHPAEDMRVINK